MRQRVALPLDAALVAAGLAATALAGVWVVSVPGEAALVTLAGPVAFAASAVAFARVPHIAFAAIIPFFAFTPMLKVFVDERIGALKDLLVVAASVAAAAVFLQRRAAGDRSFVDTAVLVLVGLIATMYVLNSGGNLTGESSYGGAWFHGTRLRMEPLLLFVAALVLPRPRRNLKYAVVSTIATACIVAAYGLAQQKIGHVGLLEFGYEYGNELRTIEGHLRSFGTLDTPFSYAAFLALGLTAAMFWPLPTWVRLLAVSVICAGLVAALVRTMLVIALGLVALTLARLGYRRGAALLLATTVVAALAVFGTLESRTSRTVQANPTLYLTLNGRTTAWEEALGGDQSAWLFGKGVGAEGTASARAAAQLNPDAEVRAAGDQPDEDQGSIVDSGYFVTITDVGLVGLAATLLFLLWIVWRARPSMRRGDPAGWLAAAVLVVLLVCALTSEAFTSFPLSYLAMLLLGLALASATEADGAEKPAEGKRRSLRFA